MKKFLGIVFLALFLILTAYIKIETIYLYTTSVFILICSLPFFVSGSKSIGIRFLYLIILISIFSFFIKYFYKFYEHMKKSGGKTLINLSFLGLSIIIIFLSISGFINYRNYINLSEKYYREAVNFYRDKDYMNAINFLKKSTAFNRLNYEAYNLLGRSYLKIESYQESEKYLLRAIKLKSDYFDPIIALGTSYEKGNKYKKAIGLYKKAKNMKPGDFGAHFGLGRVYYKINELNKSLEELLKAEKIQSNNYELQYILGNIYYKKNLLKEALEHFNFIRDVKVPKGFKKEDEKGVEDFIEEITKKLEI